LVPKYTGIINGFKTIYQEEGFKGLYRGFHISIFSQAIATAIFFWLYFYFYLDINDRKFDMLKMDGMK